MYFPDAKRCRSLLLAIVFLAPVGCADGPVPYVMSLNPYRRREWLADEQYQPTLHRQLAEIQAVRASAASMSRARQEHWVHEMTYLVQNHENPVLRAAAVETLASLAVPIADQGLFKAAKDGDSSVRVAVCQAWGRRGSEQAIQQLSELLGSDTDLDVRIAAARELGHFEEPDAYKALGLALDDSDPALQYRAVQSLKKASGHDYGSNLDAWRQFAQGGDPGPQYTPSLAQRFRRLF